MVRSGPAIDEALSWIGNRGPEELDEKPLFDTYRSQGRTHLHIAAESGNLEVVRNILGRRSELVTEVDFNGASPLHLASANGHLEVVSHLLNLNQSTCLLQDDNGNTPLHMAVKRGRIEVVKHLLDVNLSIFFLEDDKGNTPLHVAANINQIAVAELLISRLQQQPVQGVIKHTAKLQRCVIGVGPEALKQIIKADPHFLNGCDNEDENTLLHTATLLRNTQMVTYLIGRDILIAKNKNGLTALDIIQKSSKNDNLYKQILTMLKGHANKSEPMTGNFFENKRNAILVTASIIASMAFGASLNPPGGLWQEDKQSYFQALQVITTAMGIENIVILMSTISMFVWAVLTGIILLDRATWFLTKMRDLFDHATNQHNANNVAQNYGGDQNNAPIDVRN